MIKKLTGAVCLAASIWACDAGGDSDPMRNVSVVPPVMNPNMMESGDAVPDTAPDVEALLIEAAHACYDFIVRMEPTIAAGCDGSELFLEVLQPLADAHDEAARRLGLPGRGLSMRPGTPDEVRADESRIIATGCSRSPEEIGSDSLNAFALRHGVFILDPLLLAFLEGAVLWAELALQSGGIEQVDPGQLFAGLGQVFSNAAKGDHFGVINAERAGEILDSDPFAQQVFVSAVVFLVFHEVGHANLDHSMINHVVSTGVVSVLEERGVRPSDDEIARLKRSLAEVKVATETQADIYSLSLMRALGTLSSDGPRLFAIGMAGRLLVDGICDPNVAEELLAACITQDLPNATHPPLDVRVQLARRILDEGEDLTHLLEDGAVMGLVPAR